MGNHKIAKKQVHKITRNMLPTLPKGIQATGVNGHLILDFLSFINNENQSVSETSFASILIDKEMASKLIFACLSYLKDSQTEYDGLESDNTLREALSAFLSNKKLA